MMNLILILFCFFIIIYFLYGNFKTIESNFEIIAKNQKVLDNKLNMIANNQVLMDENTKEYIGGIDGD